MLSEIERRYIELTKRSVNQYLYYGDESPLEAYQTDAEDRYDDFAWKLPRAALPHSLLNADQLSLLEELIIGIERQAVVGDLIEAGVWRGGAVILMCALNLVFGSKRNVIAADSFAGIPRSIEMSGDPVDAWKDRWVASIKEVKATVSRYDLLTDKLIFVEGNFRESLNTDRIGNLALIRVDADSYESTSDALTALYPKLSVGGVVLIDDGHLPGCLLAVVEFRKSNGIRSELFRRGNNLYWIRAEL
jgi:hypothetical protein